MAGSYRIAGSLRDHRELLGKVIRIPTPPGWLWRNSSGKDYVDAKVVSLLDGPPPEGQAYCLLELDCPLGVYQWLTEENSGYGKSDFRQFYANPRNHWRGARKELERRLWSEYQGIKDKGGICVRSLLVSALDPEKPLPLVLQGHEIPVNFFCYEEGRRADAIKNITTDGPAAAWVFHNPVWLSPGTGTDYHHDAVPFTLVDWTENQDTEAARLGYLYSVATRLQEGRELSVMARDPHQEGYLIKGALRFADFALLADSAELLRDAEDSPHLTKIAQPGEYEIVGRIASFPLYALDMYYGRSSNSYPNGTFWMIKSFPEFSIDAGSGLVVHVEEAGWERLMKVDSFAKKMSGQKWRKGEVIEVDDGITFVSYPKTFVDDPAPPLDFPYSVGDWIKARGTLVIKNDTNRKPDGSHDYPIEEHHKVPC